MKTAKELYTASLNNSVVHSNRMPSWKELSEKSKCAWLAKAMAGVTAVDTAEQNDQAVAIVQEVVDVTGDNEAHPLIPELLRVSDLIEKWESVNIDLSEGLDASEIAAVDATLMRQAFEARPSLKNRIPFKRGGSVFAETVPEGEYVATGIQHDWLVWQEAWRAAKDTK